MDGTFIWSTGETLRTRQLKNLMNDFVFNNLARTKAKAIINQAKKASEQIKKEKLLQAKEKFLELKSEHEKMINNKNNELSKAENRIKDN